MKNFNKYSFVAIYGILFLTILFKVFNVPVTTDEVPTVFFYSKFNFWEIMMFPDNIPNNHILNTILAKCCIVIFGKEQWAIRLPNLFFFLLYGYSVFCILKLVLKTDSWFFLFGALLFVNPYLLDFFGLCRGYGISSTLVILSAFFLLKGYAQKNDALIWISLLTSMLASYANFTVLVFWASAVILVWIYFLMKNKGKLKKLLKPTLIIFVLSVAYLGLIMVPILKMQGTDQFKYWSSSGFYNDTIISLIHAWRYDSKILSSISFNFVAGFIVIIFLLNIYFLIKHFRKEKFSLQSFRHPLVISLLLLLLPALINIIQTILLQTPNLKGRTALFFYPLFATFILVVVSRFARFKKQWIGKGVAIALGVLLSINLLHRVSLTSVREWSYDQNTLDVIGFLNEKYDGEPVSLKTNWIFHPSFYFYSDVGKIPYINLHPYEYNIDVNTSAEYYYIFAKDYKILEPRFEVVYKFDTDRWLLKQKRF